MDPKKLMKLQSPGQLARDIIRGKGDNSAVGWYLCDGGRPYNFIVSGDTPSGLRQETLSPLLSCVMGTMPIIVLHNGDSRVEDVVYRAWQRCREGGSAAPLCGMGSKDPQYEPFLDMNGRQLVSAIRQLACKLGYSPQPALERITWAYQSILHELKLPVSLSGFYYLCQFQDVREFQSNILALPCGETKARHIWDDVNCSPDQLDLFRSVISNLAADFEWSGWTTENRIGTANCIRTIAQNGVLLLPVSNMHDKLLLPYLVEELKTCLNRPCLLILDDIRITEEMEQFIRYIGPNWVCGIVSSNAVNLVDGGEDAFHSIAGRMERFILFKHGTGKTAAVLADLMGRSDQVKKDTSKGFHKRIFSLLPEGRHQDVRYSVENRYRIMPEQLIDLAPGQAVVFNAQTNQILLYNI